MLAPSSLFPSDEELRKVLGLSEDRWRATVKRLEAEGFPEPDPVFRKRYWPAVRHYLDRRAGIDSASPRGNVPPVNEEWGHDRSEGSRPAMGARSKAPR